MITDFALPAVLGVLTGGIIALTMRHTPVPEFTYTCPVPAAVDVSARACWDGGRSGPAQSLSQAACYEQARTTHCTKACIANCGGTK